MRIVQIIESGQHIRFVDSVTDSYSGQTNHQLVMLVDDTPVGYIDYVDYRGEPSISMIEIFSKHRRSGYGTKLVQHLQSLYPNQEIIWGSTTPAGDALRNTIRYSEVPVPDIKKKIDRLQWARNQIKKMNAREQLLRDSGDIEKLRQWISTVGDRWNRLHDIISRLENDSDIRRSPFKRIIKKPSSTD